MYHWYVLSIRLTISYAVEAQWTKYVLETSIRNVSRGVIYAKVTWIKHLRLCSEASNMIWFDSNHVCYPYLKKGDLSSTNWIWLSECIMHVRFVVCCLGQGPATSSVLLHHRLCSFKEVHISVLLDHRFCSFKEVCRFTTWWASCRITWWIPMSGHSSCTIALCARDKHNSGETSMDNVCAASTGPWEVM